MMFLLINQWTWPVGAYRGSYHCTDHGDFEINLKKRRENSYYERHFTESIQRARAGPI
jgi:hypothetical protein